MDARMAAKVFCLLMVLAFLQHEANATEGRTVCSCYSFESSPQIALPWQQAKASCISNNSTLVVMETEEEWQFIDNEISKRTSNPSDEWLIGLYKNTATGNWTWLNGKPLTIDKWQPSKPRKDDVYALIAKEYPPGTHGLFNGITDLVLREWICEEETETCHQPRRTCRSLTPTPVLKQTTPFASSKTTSQFRSTHASIVSSTIQSTRKGFTPTSKSTPNGGCDEVQDKNKSTWIAIIATISVIFIIIILLLVLWIVRLVRSNRRLRSSAIKGGKCCCKIRRPELGNDEEETQPLGRSDDQALLPVSCTHPTGHIDPSSTEQGFETYEEVDIGSSTETRQNKQASKKASASTNEHISDIAAQSPTYMELNETLETYGKMNHPVYENENEQNLMV